MSKPIERLLDNHGGKIATAAIVIFIGALLWWNYDQYTWGPVGFADWIRGWWK